MKTSLLHVMAAVLFVPAIASAQPTPGAITDIEVPNVVIDTSEPGAAAADESLDLANIVQSAAKGVTTVQEAPAIVTVVTADEIKERQFTDIRQIYDLVPGWEHVGFANDTFEVPVVRGQVQAVQFLHDGLSLFDPFVNIAATTQVQAVEMIKRVEFITGPGGVLWGSNSLLGIMNVITKDAEDVDGVEVGGTIGGGRGDRSDARAYVMAGAPNLAGGLIKAFGHASFETYRGQDAQMPLLIFHDPLPQPNSANTYGPLTDSEQNRSYLVNLDAKLSYDKFILRLSFPMGHKQNPLGLSGQPVRGTLPEDQVCNADPTNPICTDATKKARDNETNNYDRYASLEYRTRFAGDKAGITARVYGIQFSRNFSPLQVLAPSLLLEGGLSFQVNLVSYRAGTALDGDVELSKQVRLLYGAEAFSEWKPDDSPDGNTTHLPSPTDLNRLPILCPRQYDAASMSIQPVADCPFTFAYKASRTVFGAYINPQWRPNKKLIFDLGGRLQVAPDAFGTLSYPVTPTVAGTMVWNFIPNWHLKLNYGQGFRPPVFNNTLSNGEGVQIGGNPNLKVETSSASQAEINARIYKGERRIRELSFRVDGSYTRLDNLIQINNGHYANSGSRGIASAEFLAKLYVQGGHRIELAYTYLKVQTADRGDVRQTPENWFDLATVFSLSPHVTATTDLKITGAFEDANRLVEYRDSTYGMNGVVVNPVSVAATDLVMDKIPAAAQLGFGITWMPVPKLLVRGTVFDALVGHAYYPDVIGDYEPHLEYLPAPVDGFRAFLSAMYQY